MKSIGFLATIVDKEKYGYWKLTRLEYEMFF